MAGSNEIKQKIVLEGEKQYSAAIKDANRNLRTLRSEMKAETAELGANATAQQKNEVKAKSLQKQIKEQEKIVKTLREALGEVREKYGDNAEEVAKWETKLNNARTSLAEMTNQLTETQNSLRDVGNGMREAGNGAAAGVVATRSLAEAIGSIADVGEGISGTIEGIFSGVVNTIRGAISEVWGDITELAAKANAWSDLAGFWNTSTANIQKWSHAVEGTKNTFEDLNNAVVRIMATDNKKIASATGVSRELYEDQWNYAMAVMQSMAEMDYNARLNASQEIFGERRATSVLDLLNDWDKIRERLDRFDVGKGGVGMTEEQMDDMATLAEQVATIQETWEAFHDSFVAGTVGKVALELTSNAQGALDALISFMNAEGEEEREAALEALQKNLTDFFTRLGEAIEAAAEALGQVGEEMQTSENGLLRVIGTVLTTLSDLLEWFTDENNIDMVIKGFEALAGFWLVGKGAQMAGTVAELVANIGTIKAFGNIGKVNTAGTGGITSAVSAAASSEFLIGSGGLAQTIVSALTSTMFTVTLAAITVPAMVNFFNEHGGISGIAEEMGKSVEESVKNAKIAIESLTDEEKMDNYKRAFQGGVISLFTGKDQFEFPEKQEKVESKRFEDLPEIEEIEIIDLDDVEPIQRAKQDLMISAAEEFWDHYKQGTGYEDWGGLREAFEGYEYIVDDLYDLMEELMATSEGRSMENLPADWWTDRDFGSGDGLTSEDISGFRTLPGQMMAAVRAGATDGISGLQVTLDGYEVGRIVAPYVSQQIAASMG